MKFYEIGNQIVLLSDIFAIGEPVYYDGCTILLYIHSRAGAKIEVKFKAKNEDNCSISGPIPNSFIERTNNEIRLFIKECENI